MPAIKMLSGLQEQMACDAKVGFLSILGAMGGPGTMKRIVDEHGWGSSDYVHINWDGASLWRNDSSSRSSRATTTMCAVRN